MRNRSKMAAFAFAVVALGCSMTSTYVLGAPKWSADTRFYAVRALEFAGRDHEAAKAEAGAFLRSKGGTDPISSVDVLPDARLFRPRVLYPLLSAPFVRLAGMNGLLVVPFLATLAFAAILWRILTRRGSPWTAAAVFALVVNCAPFTIYSYSALTDGLALALVAAAVLGFPGEHRLQGRPVLVYAATAAAGFTREVAVYVSVAALCGWIWSRRRAPAMERGWRLVLLAAAAGTTLTVAFATVTGPGKFLYQIEKFAGGDSVLQALPRLLGGALRQTVDVILDDSGLLTVLLLGLCSLALRPRLDGILMAAATTTALAFLAINPIGTSFRLQLPLLPFAAPAAVAALDGLGAGPRKRRPVIFEPATTLPADADPVDQRRPA